MLSYTYRAAHNRGKSNSQLMVSKTAIPTGHKQPPVTQWNCLSHTVVSSTLLNGKESNSKLMLEKTVLPTENNQPTIRNWEAV
jgi:hypothetical protein